MSKVIVERPRLKGGTPEYPRASLRDDWRARFEDAPPIESMGRGYRTKQLNENLRPLMRFLRSNVGRRWKKFTRS
jgi:hypothetical protein